MRRAITAGLAVCVLAVLPLGCGGPDINALITQGITQYQLGHLDQAHETLGRALREDPSNARALFYMGRVYFARGSYEQALCYFQFALDADPGYPEIHEHLQRAERAAGTVGPALRFIPETRKQ